MFKKMISSLLFLVIFCNFSLSTVEAKERVQNSEIENSQIAASKSDNNTLNASKKNAQNNYQSSAELDRLRLEIDEIQDSLIDLLQRRSEVVKKIALIKQANNMPIFDPAREDVLIEKIKKMALEKNVNPQMAEVLIRIILSYSKTDMLKELKNNQ